MTAEHRFSRQGLLAFDPRAVFDLFLEPPSRENETHGPVEVVSIVGPLDHHAGVWSDSYDAIADRVSAALEGNARAVVMKIDSPGGVVGGAFETARGLRILAERAGKELIAYVEGSCCSAAYALACAATRIVGSETAVAGSIGVIDCRLDATANDAAQGLRYALITSGNRKADGNPHQPISAAELVEKQGLVDDIASVFYALVRDLRGIDPEPLEARLFVGRAAKSAGLLDEVQSFTQLLASLASPAQETVMSAYEDARAALEEIAKGEGDEAARARRALRAMDEDEEPEAESEDDEKSDDEPAAENGDDEKKKKDEEEEPEGAATASSASSATLRAMAAEIQRSHAQRQKDDAGERGRLLASYPDLAPQLRKLLATAEIGVVKDVLASLPKPVTVKRPKADAAAATPRATRGDTQGTGRSEEPHAKVMDERMGLTRTTMGVRREGNSLVFGAMQASAGNGGAK